MLQLWLADEIDKLLDVGFAFAVGFVVVFPAVALRFSSECGDIRVEAVAPMMAWFPLQAHAGLTTHTRGLQLAFQAEPGNLGLIIEAPGLDMLGETSVVVAEIERTYGIVLTCSRNPAALSIRVDRANNDADVEICRFLVPLIECLGTEEKQRFPKLLPLPRQYRSRNPLILLCW